MQCGATEYKGTTLGITKQAFRYILLHQIKIVKMIKALFYKGLGAKERKRERGYDNSTYANGNLYIEQKNIPAIAGNKGFTDTTSAANTAKLVIQKLKQGEMPPTINITDLKNIKAL